MTPIYFLVTWTLFFRPNLSEHWKQEARIARFNERHEAILFIRHSPEDGEEFECVNSTSGENGFCKIADIFTEKSEGRMGGKNGHT